MAQPPTRNIWLIVIQNIINSLKPRRIRGDVVGKDYLGNTYYQIQGSERQKRQRWFEPTVKDNFEQEIPAEWEAWLRYRRKVRPTDEEVLANAAIAQQKKINAARLEKERKVLPSASVPVKGPETFPVYDDYEVVPGKERKK